MVNTKQLLHIVFLVLIDFQLSLQTAQTARLVCRSLHGRTLEAYCIGLS